MKIKVALVSICMVLYSCNGEIKPLKTNQKNTIMTNDSTKQYGYNRDFLNKFTKVLELKNGKSAISIVQDWQGRVMTSTADGDSGFSFGWINRELIESGRILPHINAFGGEERIWLGPEGGQYSLFFRKGKQFVFEDWQTPDYLDTTPYELVSKSDTSVVFAKDINTENYSGTLFSIRLERAVTIMNSNEIDKLISVKTTGLNSVAYKSENKIINRGEKQWKKETGLLSIWMLGMFNPSPSVIVVIPVKPGDEKAMGNMVNDNYFGKINEDRLKVIDNNIFFKADGRSRGKIGIPPLRAIGIMGSYDFDNNTLTLLICKLPEGKTDYVNSAWQIQDNPFAGDALNSYNDGPLEDGSQMGPFYELETSSPAADLKPGESLSHIQYTIHLTGVPDELDKVSRRILGVSIEDIRKSF